MSWSGCAALRILVVRSLRGDRIFCAVSARAASWGYMRPSVCRTGSCQGRVGPFREFVRPGASRVFLQSVSMCRHARTRVPVRRGAGASSLPATDSISLFFSRHRRRKRGCGYPLLELPVRGRSFRPPSRRVFRRPLRRGGRVLPGQAPGIWSRMAGVLALRDRTLSGRPK